MVDDFARGIAIVSLLVAIAAIAIPLFEQRRQFRILQTEDLAVQLTATIGTYLQLTTINFGSMGRVVQIPWGLILSNTGNQKLSIVSYRVREYTLDKLVFYSGLDGGIFSPDGAAVSLPMMLDQGESRVFSLMIGFRVQPKVYEVLSSAADAESHKVHNAVLVLGRQGIDMYGSEVSYKEYERGEYIISSRKDNPGVPRYSFEALSGRGNSYEVSAAAQ